MLSLGETGHKELLHQKHSAATCSCESVKSGNRNNLAPELNFLKCVDFCNKA